MFVRRPLFVCCSRCGTNGFHVPRMQAIDTVDDLVRRTVVRATTLWQPRKRSPQQLLLREIAIDGGRKPGHLPADHLTLRLKYALDGSRCVAIFQRP